MPKAEHQIETVVLFHRKRVLHEDRIAAIVEFRDALNKRLKKLTAGGYRASLSLIALGDDDVLAVIEKRKGLDGADA